MKCTRRPSGRGRCDDRDEFEADGRARTDERREEREIGAHDLSEGKDGVGEAFSQAFIRPG